MTELANALFLYALYEAMGPQSDCIGETNAKVAGFGLLLDYLSDTQSFWRD